MTSWLSVSPPPRFAAECELLGQLHHPHIVQFLGVRVETGSELPELVMEYLPTTLSRYLDTHGALPTETSCTILLQVALGLRYLHEFSPPIIHRDLSSNNVLLTTGMTAKISDLGVAKILDVSPTCAARMTQTQAPGTPTFMPPETMFSRPKYTSKVDIFSFGVLVVHVLSGEWPMPSGTFAEDPHDLYGVVLVTEFERRRESINRISEGHPLLGLIEQCLSNVASCRPVAAEVVHQLLVEHDRVPPRPENGLELLHQVQSQTFRDEVEALRRENVTLRKEIETVRAENDAEMVTATNLRAGLQRDVESLRTELALREERAESVDNEAELVTVCEHFTQELQAVRRASDMLLAEKRRDISLLEGEQLSLESQRAGLQREVESHQTELALREERSRAEIEMVTATNLRAGLQRDVVSLRAELALREERAESVHKEAELVTVREHFTQELQAVRRASDMLLAEKRRDISLLEGEQLSLVSQRAGLQREVESLQTELALREERSRAETESLRAQVQRLTVQPRATPPEASTLQV